MAARSLSSAFFRSPASAEDPSDLSIQREFESDIAGCTLGTVHDKVVGPILNASAGQVTGVQVGNSFKLVLMQYFGYLRRDPNSGPDADFGGYNFWLNKLNSFNGDYIKAEMVKAFISSQEYRQRFAP